MDTETLEHNLAVIPDWARLYNTDRETLITRCYAPDCRVLYNGVIEVLGHDQLREFQARADAHAPHRQLTVERTYATADTVIVEASAQLQPGATARAYTCVVLTFRDGKIVEDHTYADLSGLSSNRA